VMEMKKNELETVSYGLVKVIEQVEADSEEREKQRENDEKRFMIESINVPSYTANTGIEFAHSIRTQLKICGIEMGDPDVNWVLRQRIYSQLCGETSMGIRISNVEQMLRDIEKAFWECQSMEDVIGALKREVWTTNPECMFRKTAVYLRSFRPSYSDSEIDEDAWSVVRERIYGDTAYRVWAAKRKAVPTDKEFESMTAEWKSVRRNMKCLLEHDDVRADDLCSGVRDLGIGTDDVRQEAANVCAVTCNHEASYGRKGGVRRTVNGNWTFRNAASAGSVLRRRSFRPYGENRRYACHNCLKVGHYRRECKEPDRGFRVFYGLRNRFVVDSRVR